MSIAAGQLYGIGLGPGDPELLTVKAVRLLQAAPIVAYFAKSGRRGNARTIADRPQTCLSPLHKSGPRLLGGDDQGGVQPLP